MLSHLIVATFLGAHAQGGEKISLRFNPQVNDRFEYRTQVKLQGTDMGAVKLTIHTAEKVLSMTNSEIQSRTYFAGTSSAGTGILGELTAQFKQIINRSYERSMSRNGVYKDPSKYSEFGLSSVVDLVYPSQPIGLGDTWTEMVNLGTDVGKVEVTYKLASFSKDEAIVIASIGKTDRVETIQPYRFLIDRKSGKFRMATGAIRVNFQGVSVDADFKIMMLIPVQPMSFWWTDGKQGK